MSEAGASREGAGCRRALGLGLAVAAVWLLFALWRLDDFGPTWDAPQGEYGQGEQYLGYLLTGERAYLDFSRPMEDARPPCPRLEHRAPHPAWPDRLYLWFEAHPLGGILSAASCRLLWDTLGWMPAMPAHHLPIVLVVALLAAVLARWAATRWGLAAGLAAALALLLSPRFLADAFNNLKDAPEACLYALAVLAFAAALARPRPLRFALAGALTGLALAQKFNALFIPPQVLLYWGLANLARRRRGRPALPFPWAGAPVAALCGAAAWLACSPMLWTDTWAGASAMLDYWRRQGVVPIETNRWDGLLSWLWTTPPAILLLAALGAVRPRLDSDDRCLLLTGALLPIGRTMLPGAINFDGVRHFLEFQPFLALLAAAGTGWLLERLVPRPAGEGGGAGAGGATGGRARVVARGLLLASLFAQPATAAVTTWPHGTCYFNAFVGGLGGAQRRGVASATDYWAGSYWQGLEWLSAHAEPAASLLVPVAAPVAAAAAPVRLRPDLALLPVMTAGGEPPALLYVMYVTRPAFYEAVAHDLDARSRPVHELSVQGGTILKIHRLASPDEVARALALWATNADAARAAQRLGQWAAAQPPEVLGRVVRAVERARLAGPAGEAEGWAELSSLLPEALHDDARLVLRHESRDERP